MPINPCQIILDKDEPCESGETVNEKFVIIVKQGYDHKGNHSTELIEESVSSIISQGYTSSSKDRR